MRRDGQHLPEARHMIGLRTAALGLAILAGSATFAGAQTTTPNGQRPSVQRDSTRHRGAKGQRAGRNGRGMRALFKDIQLSAEQRTQIKAIADKYQGQRKPLAESMRPVMTEVRAARQRGDSAAARAALERTADSRSKLTALREQQLRDVRGVLTAAQQQTFDRNVAAMKDKMQKRQGHRGRRA
jgi:protein CpxP